MVFFMNVTIKPLSNNPKEIEDVKKFLFKMITLEFGYGYVPEWHQDIVNLEDYYIIFKALHMKLRNIIILI